MTATPERIRLCVRESEFATSSDAAVLAARGDAVDGYDRAIFSFFDNTADAQLLLNERFAFQKTVRRHEAAEVAGFLSIGAGIPIAPTVPKARMIDDTRPMNRIMLIKGMAIDFNSDRNSIECDG